MSSRLVLIDTNIFIHSIKKRLNFSQFENQGYEGVVIGSVLRELKKIFPQALKLTKPYRTISFKDSGDTDEDILTACSEGLVEGVLTNDLELLKDIKKRNFEVKRYYLSTSNTIRELL